MADDPTNKDSLLDNLEEVVDVVLGEGIKPPEPESLWERRQRMLDSWTAIILAIAAVATAWASFQASNWRVNFASDAQAASATARADAGRAATAAAQGNHHRLTTWLDWVSAVDDGKDARADFLDNRFSPQLRSPRPTGSRVPGRARWSPEVIPPGTPLDLPS